MKLLVLAWKNIWRNPLRSGVVTTAIALGLFCGVFSVAFMNGMGIQAVDAVISRQTGHIQLHDSLYMQEPLLSYQLKGADSMVAALRSEASVKAVAARIKIDAMGASAKSAAGITVLGVEPDAERMVSKLPEDMVAGGFFEKGRHNSAVVGAKFAKKLGLKERSKFVITTQRADGELTGGAFRVVGIYETNNTLFDETVLFVRKEDLSRLVGIPEQAAHEIVILLNTMNATDSVAAALRKPLTGVNVATWNSIAPEVGMIESLMQQMLYIFVMVILIALSFGIVNTMLMAVLERKREFGMLMAVGMSRIRVFGMVLIETVLLALTGGILGMTGGGVVVLAFARTGINLGFLGEGLRAMGYNPMVYPFINSLMFITISMMVVATGVLASLYPAYKAIKLNPAEAVRSDT